MSWQFRRYGTAEQPVHKSDLNELSGSYACPKRFRYSREQPRSSTGLTVAAKTALGTATHEVIARVLGNRDSCARLLCAGELPEPKHLELALRQELANAAEGRELDCAGDELDKLIEARISMLSGLLASVPSYIAQVVAVEVGFAVAIDGMHLAGHIDLVYRPRARPATLALADWKTGGTKPHPIELAHGWESGIYSLALSHGVFLPRAIATAALIGADGRARGYESRCNAHVAEHESRWQAERNAFELALISLAHGNDEPGSLRFDEFPSAIYHVHLGDYVPYQRAGRRMITRPDELEHYGLSTSGSIAYRAGDTRGPGWLRVERRERDIPRLAHRLRAIIGTVRMGRFIDVVNEQCTRCPYAVQCLNEGYEVSGDELAQVQAQLKAAGL